ncbi:MAG: WD40/YVTN/BNR-like repeat-containing protein [Fimbriimonadaceae bacterium]
MVRPVRFLALSLLMVGIVGGSSPVAMAQPVGSDHPVLADLKWREIGPYRGGRSVAVSGVNGDPKTFFMGTTGGGVWRTSDEGETWKCVSDGFFKTGTVGAIAVAASQPKTVYVGMGEHAIRGNITPGDGVYRSDDGGDTWRYLGLKETQFIGRIVVDAKDPETAWVAALGPVFGPSNDRGIYKTTNGGKSWKKTLFVSDVAGAIDISCAPSNPKVMIASTWEAWRRPWELVSGGAGSGLYMSSDGGDTWKSIRSNPGLPGGIWGRIGVSVSPADPNRIFAMIEAAERGLYRSDDQGKTWELINGDAGPRQRPWYYSNVYADPKARDTVYVLNVQYFKSTDGGKSMRTGVAGHSDHHDMWIDPSDNARLVMGNDGGAAVSTNSGAGWSAQDYPTGQFYHVSVDNAFPYNILAAQQDNSTVRIPSRTRGAGIKLDDWTSTSGGESGYVTAKPDNPDIVFGGNYGGDLSWTNHRLNTGRSVDPWPDNPIGRGAIEAVERFQWTYPIVFSPHDPNVLYVGSQHVLRSRNMGASWERISPDLTTNDSKKMQPSGGPISKDNTAVEVHCTVFTIAESPVQKGVIWSGSDDGLVYVTLDDGKTWTNVTPKGVPSGATISMIEASPEIAGRAIAAVNNYRQNDFKPYIFVTDDYGKTWKADVAGLPGEYWVHAVREDSVDKELFFAATEEGVYAKYGSGKWSKLGGIPEVPVHDLVLKENEMVIATHGRGIFVLDSIVPVRSSLAMATVPDIALFPAYGNNSRFGPVGSGEVGKNPSGYGLRVEFWSKQDRGSAELTMLDADQVAVAKTTINKVSKGLNVAYLMPSYAGMESFTGMLFWGGYTGSLKAPPRKDYQVTLKFADVPLIRTFADWGNNPLSEASDEDMVAKYKLCREIADMASEVNRWVVQCRGYRTAIQEQVKGTKEMDDRAAYSIRLLDSIENALYQNKAKAGQDLLNFPMQLNNRLSALLGFAQGGDFAAPKQAWDVLESLRPLYNAEKERLEGFKAKLVSELNQLLKAAGKPELAPKFEELRPGRGGIASGGGEKEVDPLDFDGL